MIAALNIDLIVILKLYLVIDYQIIIITFTVQKYVFNVNLKQVCLCLFWKLYAENAISKSYSISKQWCI